MSIEFNNALGAKRDAVLDNMLQIMDGKALNPETGQVYTAGEKSAALLQAQEDLGTTDGTDGIARSIYKRWAQTGS